MRESITLSPPNSLILVMDHSFGELPQVMGGRLVAFTDSCVAVGTLSEADGVTSITLADDLQVIDEPSALAFDGVLHTPAFELSVCNVRNEKLLTLQLPTPRSKVRIFVNDKSEPDRIMVYAGPA